MEILAFLIDFNYYPMQFWEKIFRERGSGFSLQHNFGAIGVDDFHMVPTTFGNYWSHNFDILRILKTLIRKSQISHLIRFSFDQAFSYDARLRRRSTTTLLDLLGFRRCVRAHDDRGKEE